MATLDFGGVGRDEPARRGFRAALEAGWSRLLGRLAYLEALGLVAAVVASVRHNDTAYSVAALVIGVLLGPLVAVLLGLQLGRAGRAATA